MRRLTPSYARPRRRRSSSRPSGRQPRSAGLLTQASGSTFWNGPTCAWHALVPDAVVVAFSAISTQFPTFSLRACSSAAEFLLLCREDLSSVSIAPCNRAPAQRLRRRPVHRKGEGSGQRSAQFKVHLLLQHARLFPAKSSVSWSGLPPAAGSFLRLPSSAGSFSSARNRKQFR